MGRHTRPSKSGKDQGCQSGRADGVLPLLAARTYEEGLLLETGIPRFRDSAVLVSGRTGDDIIYSSTPQYRPDEPVSVFKELHGHLLLHRQAREARLWAEAEDEAHIQGRQGFRGVSTPSHHRLSQQISQSYRVHFCYLAFGQECYLIMVRRIHSLLHQL